MKHKTAILCSALLWVLAGVLLLYRGMQLLGHTLDQERATLLLGGALLLGFVKGRFVLSKSAARVANRILSLPLPIRLTQIYPKSYLALLALMMAFGFALRFVPPDWRGFVDVAVGTALLQGANAYFRIARTATSSSL